MLRDHWRCASAGQTPTEGDLLEIEVGHLPDLVLVSATQGDLHDILELSPQRAEQLAVQLTAAARLARATRR